MKLQILTSVSVMALLLVAPAIAQNYGSSEGGPVVLRGNNSFDILRVPSIREGLFGLEVNYLTLDQNRTADRILGQPVYNAAGEKIADIDDIIVNDAGKATMVVFSEGGFLGIGENLMAYDYNLVMNKDEDGDSIMPLDETVLSRGMNFSYDAAANEADTLIMPVTSYRVSDILDAKVIGPLGKEVAEAENATLQDGELKHVILDLEDLTDTGDDFVAMPYDTLATVAIGGELNFQLTSEQSRMLEDFIRMDVSVR